MDAIVPGSDADRLDPLEIPTLCPGAMAASQPWGASPDHQKALGFPGELVDDWQNVAIAKMGELLEKNRALRVYLDSCVKCGACTDKCHYFLGTGDPKNMPVARQDLLRKVYRRYFTFTGKYFPGLVGAEELTKEVIDDWYSYFHQCSQCRRCSVFCPYGIDTAEISMAGREILDAIGKGQKYCNEIIGKVHTIGNNLGLNKNALRSTLEGLEEDIEDDIGVPVKLPLDVKGADILLVTPSADFFAEPHVDGLIGYAKVFHAAGASWTISSYASEAANFGMFIGSYEQMRLISLRIREAALDLGVKRIVFGECGHAWRVAYSFLNTLAGPFDFLDQRYPIPQHICEYTWDLIQKGALEFDKSKNDHIRLTYHDSCNVARATRMGDQPGGQFEIPRAILKTVCNHYFDMAQDTIRDQTFCCGGGGGLLTDELMDIRKKGASPRMKALKTVAEDHGVTHMAAICAICKTQFAKVMPDWGFERDSILSVHQLVSNAIILQKPKQENDDDR
ncbi:sulfate reduction electron transfer complex DsrMKJOP subunit DsrK [Pinisolibacter aquiterrae]|uniref:sulfate reduction electron transfer complex DsrMKJOP subunit DsrK n=1 Tax=Pinisolibacter aquiterrae TaxID=2815579 RepID=UPI001C3D5FC3|nr:(Fe-S)-binding protein [Pinisolibacter aquiterrae]MBV5264397.1 (Fe-S)-binding protein [Pinisolibacter aquiterrae]MCC8234454.1 (Fe-S)-binding protein [Pinisolibacter aquiterrae]